MYKADGGDGLVDALRRDVSGEGDGVALRLRGLGEVDDVGIADEDDDGGSGAES